MVNAQWRCADKRRGWTLNVGRCRSPNSLRATTHTITEEGNEQHEVQDQKVREARPEMRLLFLWIVWLVLSFGVRLIPDEVYQPYFHLFGAITALSLLVITLEVTKHSREWWRPEIATVYMLSLLHVVGDFLFDFPIENFNTISKLLNSLEATILFGAGGGTYLYELWRRRSPASPDRRRSRSDGPHRTQGVRIAE